MAFYNSDLSTRAGALDAAHKGAWGAFVFAIMGVIGLVSFVVLTHLETHAAIAGAASASVEAIVALIAGLRLRRGQGLWWTVATALFLVMEVVAKLAGGSIAGALISAVVLLVLVQGIRGAWALRHGAPVPLDEVPPTLH